MEKLPPELESLFLFYLEAHELLRYATCNRLAFTRVSDFIEQHYSTRRLLGSFFSTEEGYRIFREVQRRYGVLVSGSQVTGLFIRNTEMFTTSDLDVYVNLKREPALAAALAQTGYHLHADLTKEGGATELDDNALLLAMDTNEMILRTKYVFSAIASVKEYHNQEGKVVQVIASHGPPMDIILGFHSSKVP
ncbi:uncharacterized protein ARMOST_19889 [Armillaria ostoyae]|uniref:F-box domain-containing protein n=1 Tax=Armillaria ostoyae TaxID=47428 RepID=A0A284S5T9_ARMOS|nr:uncharacterized protein ARMOST_19889 [Armillaria ostoyae]